MSADQPGVGTVSLILRAEAVVLLLAGVLVYFLLDGNALWLIPLLLAPDLSMVGYLGGPRLGAVTYNVVHNLVLGIIVLVGGWFLDSGLMTQIGALLVAHVGMDRASGFGLKLPTDFRDTHLGRIGR